MTAREMANEFVRTMNPEMRTDENACYAVYEFPADSKYHLELCFVDEEYAESTRFYTAVDLVGGSESVKCAYAETMTDVDMIAAAIEEVMTAKEE